MTQEHKKELQKTGGYGGIRCPCCGWPPSQLKFYSRYVKRKLRQRLKKEMDKYK